MSIVLFNPTNEDFEMMFGGKSLFLNHGEKMKVDDACGRHLLNGFTARGIAVLEFSEDSDYLTKTTEDGIRRNLAFKKNMVMQHNHRNVVRKQQGMSYMEPTPAVRKYAAELGITLDEPYATRDKENERMAVLESENKSLKGSINDLMDQVKQLLALQTKPEAEVKKEPVSQQRK
jgi:hypothetical protein